MPVPKRHHLDKRADLIAAQGGGSDDDLLCDKELAARLGCSPVWLQSGRHYGYGPPFLRLGRRIRYRWGDVRRWLDERLAEAAADLAARREATLAKAAPKVEPAVETPALPPGDRPKLSPRPIGGQASPTVEPLR